MRKYVLRWPADENSFAQSRAKYSMDLLLSQNDP